MDRFVMGKHGKHSPGQERVLASTVTVGALAAAGAALVGGQPSSAAPRDLAASVSSRPC
jgi:hypothetical protein